MDTRRKRHWRSWFALLLLLCAACAVGHVSPSGDVVGVAFGRASLSSGCQPTPTAVPVTPQPAAPSWVVTQAEPAGPCTAQSRIEGGPLSLSAAEMIGSAITAVVSYFSAGAL